MTTQSEHERRASELLATEAAFHASSFCLDGDVTAQATAILIAAIELLNPNIAKDRDRLARLILGENE